MNDRPTPPVAKYRLTVTITANSADDIERELDSAAIGFPHRRDGRDAMDSTNGTVSIVLEHTNPEQTPEAYDRELDDWWHADRAWRRERER